ncbi:hypothetical protein [Glaciimonas sp. PCH181]|uniref:hypothetical protein n=1 Tax=Glaciimonas sp. PCH181 TaxID=2133943 RepID=UPI00191C3B20|nr:hypothetical protein [Glaciimonas sp. PCH181]
MREARPLETSIEALLADSAYEGHPLRQPLADLYVPAFQINIGPQRARLVFFE